MTLDELITPITADQWRTSIYDVMRRVGLCQETWRPGAVVRTIVTAVAIMLASLSALIARIARSGFLDTAEGRWLDLIAWNQYREKRLEASYATGQVRITNSGGGIYQYDPGDLHFLNPTTHKTYTNTGDVTIGALSSVLVDVRATELGAASSTGAGTITQLETPELGLSVSNPRVLVGIEEETDAELRVRCVEKAYTLGIAGAREAYSYWAKTAQRADGSRVGVNKVSVSDGSSVGHVDVIVATATGALSAEDLAIVDETLRQNALPRGATLTTHSASPVTINVAGEVWVYIDYGNMGPSMRAELEENMAQSIPVVFERRLREYIDRFPIGGFVFKGSRFVPVDMLRIAPNDVIDSAGRIGRTVLSLPTTDVPLLPDSIPVLGTVTITGVHFVQLNPS